MNVHIHAKVIVRMDIVEKGETEFINKKSRNNCWKSIIFQNTSKGFTI